MNWYLHVLRNYANFSGRARRSEYWYFVLFNLLFSVAAMIVDNVLGTTFDTGLGFSMPYGFVYLSYILAVFIPGLAAAVRRLHDIGKSGWMILVALIPLAGAIWLLVLLLTDSNPGENAYGSNQKTTIVV